MGVVSAINRAGFTKVALVTDLAQPAAARRPGARRPRR